MELEAICCHLVGGWWLKGGQEWNPNSSLNHLNNEAWSCSTCFFMVDMPLDLLYKMRPLRRHVHKTKILGPTIFLWQIMHKMTWLFLKSTCWLLFTLKNVLWVKSFNGASTKQVVFSLFSTTPLDQEGHHHYEAWVPNQLMLLLLL